MARASTEPAHLAVRPVAEPGTTPPHGLRPLELEGERDALLYVPPTRPDHRPTPALVFLHGAGGDARGALTLVEREAEQAGVALILPVSHGRTWDVILGAYGPDVRLLDRAVERAFAQHWLDPACLAIGGFSDGASYALSVGLANGNVFRRILAFSPGFLAPAPPRGRPLVFVSHGTEDDVLPIGPCSRRLVPGLRRVGYEVIYREFAGGHWIPADLAREALSALAMAEDGPDSRAEPVPDQDGST